MPDPTNLDYWLSVEPWDLLDIGDDGSILASGDEGETRQLFLVTPTQRRQLTALSGPCTGRLLPGEPTVVIQHDRDGDGRFDLSGLDIGTPACSPAGERDLTPVTRAATASDFLMDTGPGWIAYMTNRRNGTDFDVILRQMSTGTEKCLYTLGGHVCEVAVRTDPDDALRDPTAAVTVFTTQGLSTHLYLSTADATHTLSDRDQLGIHSTISISPDLRSVVASSDATSERLNLRRFEIGTGAQTIACDQDGDVFAVPSPDGKLLATLHFRRGITHLTIRRDNGDLVHSPAVPGAGQLTVRWSPSSQWLAVQADTVYSPSEIYRLHCSNWEPELIISADQQHQIRRTRHVSSPDYIEIPTRDGHTIPCHIYRPERCDQDRGAPAVVYLHGGPEDNEVETFSPLKQYLTDAGFIVVAPDVRGSTGYGKTWYSLDDRRLRMNAVDDLADIHAWLPRIGVDPARTALAGASYGGYLTLCGMVFQPGLWAAGVDIMGIASLVTYLENTAPYLQRVRESEYGYLEHDREFLIEASPLYHAADARAPILIIHGANDPRVPLSESEQFAAAVRRVGGECSLTVFPDEGHGLSRKANRHTAYAQIATFLHQHLTTNQPEPA
ncbi:S9 family peptidase [Nocardia asteroides]|uniref:S9 family peptidase n=1 Tax=Nocardia asteroides TaxID=1824 RepID=UPI0037C5BE06